MIMSVEVRDIFKV